MPFWETPLLNSTPPPFPPPLALNEAKYYNFLEMIQADFVVQLSHFNME